MVDSFAVGQARLALQDLPLKTNVVVNVTDTETVTTDGLSALRQLGEMGVAVTIRGAIEVVRRLCQSVGVAVHNFSWAET
jgi:hypothetical protein